LIYDGETFVANKSNNLASILVNVRLLVHGLLYKKTQFEALESSGAITESKEALAIESVNLDIEFTKVNGEIVNKKFDDLSVWDTTEKVDFYIPPKTKQI
jgi:hypothetical protein